MTLRVLVAGAGIGGLTLAHGLRRAGIDVAVYERDAAPDTRRQGYRVHIDQQGGAALRRCLPDHLVRLYEATSNRANNPVISAVDHQLTELFAHRADIGDADPDTMDTAVNRLTLRQILLTDIASTVHFGHEVRAAECTADGVTVRFAGGGSARGDLLVAADGVQSPIRAAVMPELTVEDTGLRVVYGKTTLTGERLGWLPERFRHGFTAVVGPHGRAMAVGMLRKRIPVPEAVAAHAPGAALDDFADYLMWAMVTQLADYPVDDNTLLHTDPATLHRYALDLTDGWHPVLRRTIAEAEVAECFPIPIRTTRTVLPPPPGRITLLGDAVHPMTPAGGSGANTALRDAAQLTELLSSTEPVAALKEYAQRMPEYATVAVQESLRNAGLA